VHQPCPARQGRPNRNGRASKSLPDRHGPNDCDRIQLRNRIAQGARPTAATEPSRPGCRRNLCSHRRPHTAVGFAPACVPAQSRGFLLTAAEARLATGSTATVDAERNNHATRTRLSQMSRESARSHSTPEMLRASVYPPAQNRFGGSSRALRRSRGTACPARSRPSRECL